MEKQLSSSCLQKLLDTRNKIKTNSGDYIDDFYLDTCSVFCNFVMKCPLYRRDGSLRGTKLLIEPEIDQEIREFISDHVFLPKG